MQYLKKMTLTDVKEKCPEIGQAVTEKKITTTYIRDAPKAITAATLHGQPFYRIL